MRLGVVRLAFNPSKTVRLRAVSPSRPCFRKAPRTGAVKTGQRPPPKAARSGLDGPEHGEMMARTGRSCRVPQQLLSVLLQMVHVQIAHRFEPVVVGLDRERPYQPQA